MNDRVAKTCPKCGSDKVKSKRSWSSVFAWAALLAVAFFVSLIVKDDRLNAGAQAMMVLLIIPVIAFAISAARGMNRCLNCQHSWK